MTDTQTLTPPTHAAGAPWKLSDARSFLGISERTLRTLMRSGKVRTITVGARPMVPDDEVRRIAREGTA